MSSQPFDPTDFLRDYEVPLTPSSGAHKPEKAKFRAWASWAGQQVTTLTDAVAAATATAIAIAANANAGAALTTAGVTYPTVYASALPRGVTGTTGLAGGSGGTNGTFALGISAGSIIGAAGTFTVPGGAVTSIAITKPGLGSGTAPPTLSFAASSGLTGASATAVLGSLIPQGGTYWAVASTGLALLLFSNDGTATPAAVTVAGQQVAIPTLSAYATSIAFGGQPTAPTAADGTATLQIANSAFVQKAITAALGAYKADAAILSAMPSGAMGIYLGDRYRAQPRPYIPNLVPAPARSLTS